MGDLDALKRIDLPGFLSRHYGLKANGRGMALCPFHEDLKPSFSISEKGGTWLWKCHGCGAGGTVLDFTMKKEGLTLGAAAGRIRELEGIAEEPRPRGERRPEIVRVHSYTDENGVEVWQKVKLSDGSVPLPAGGGFGRMDLESQRDREAPLSVPQDQGRPRGHRHRGRTGQRHPGGARISGDLGS